MKNTVHCDCATTSVYTAFILYYCYTQHTADIVIKPNQLKYGQFYLCVYCSSANLMKWPKTGVKLGQKSLKYFDIAFT